MAMSEKTAKVYAAIREEAATGAKYIVAATYTHFHGRAATSAAFRRAVKDGIIERYATGGNNNPIYRGIVASSILN